MRALVRRFDAWLSRRYGVFEFSQSPDCLLRLQVAVARREISLPGCQVRGGERVLLLHLWNERLPAPSGLALWLTPQWKPSGRGLAAPAPGLGWAKTLQRSFLHSLGEVARYLGDHPELAEARAVGGVTVLLGAGGHAGGARLVERLGFSVLPCRSPLGRFGEFWENCYTWILMWTYNPASLAYHRFWSLRRKEFWMPVGEFRRRFGHES